MSPQPVFDVVIVGGRPSGSTLAARLGQQGVQVLLLERSEMPSLPAVSSPIIYSSAMRLLDEIGAREDVYARNTPKIHRWVTEIRNDFMVENPIPMWWGRDYAYAVDRARFDYALWCVAASFPTVEVRDRFVVTDLLHEGEMVTGVVGRGPDGVVEQIAARLVVGADGRYNLVARKASAATIESREELPTTLYYAYWENVKPYDEKGPCVHLFAPGGKMGFLLMESADGTVAAVMEGQSSYLQPAAGESAEAMYLRLLWRYPQMRHRLEGARPVTTVRGIKKVGNMYRAAGGPGWAIVGDAFHQVDPLDGQGIYDAVFTARVLAEAIGRWRRGEQPWDAALAHYEEGVRAETYGVFITTLERVERELYAERPEWTWNTLIRWLLQDEEYRRLSGLFLVRAIPPEAFDRDALFKRALPRGIWRDLRARLKRRGVAT